MEQDGEKKIYRESKHILGVLYRSVDCKDFYNQCVEGDHQKAVILDYRLSPYILRDDANPTRPIPPWHALLKIAYKEFVVPMQDELKKIMVQYKILNEGELFCTNLNFNLDDERFSKIIGDPGQKDEDAVKSLN